MVSKQFSRRRYTLPAEAKLTKVVSNLSQVSKEKKIQEKKKKMKQQRLRIKVLLLTTNLQKKLINK